MRKHCKDSLVTYVWRVSYRWRRYTNEEYLFFGSKKWLTHDHPERTKICIIYNCNHSKRKFNRSHKIYSSRPSPEIPWKINYEKKIMSRPPTNGSYCQSLRGNIGHSPSTHLFAKSTPSDNELEVLDAGLCLDIFTTTVSPGPIRNPTI